MKNCVSNYSKIHWPPAMTESELQNKTYNVLVYEFHEDKHGTYFVAMTADAKNMNGEGDTIENSLNDLRKVMESAATDYGGVYPDTSDFEYQEKSHAKLENAWKEDGLEIINRTRHTITIFPNDDISPLVTKKQRII